MIEIIIFIFGSVVGSFLNVVICRLETGEGIIKKRSHCPKCGRVLAWYDLIPIISFFWLRGRCRTCKGKISIQYPLVEVAAGALFVLAFYLNYESRIMNYGAVIHNSLFIIQLLRDWFIISCLVIIFVYDLRHYIIPDKVLWPAIGVVFFYRLFEIGNFRIENLLEIGNWKLEIFYPYLLAALGAAAFFWFLVAITRGRGMGLGDVKLAFLMGLVLGWPKILVALFLAFFAGTLVGVGLIIAGKKTMKSQVPFGPFLILGTFITLFWGQGVVNFYLTLFM